MQKKLFATYFSLIVFTLIVAIYFIWSNGNDFFNKEYQQQFITQGQLLSDLLKEAELNNLEDYNLFIKTYSKKLNTRITIIDNKGNVIADSDEDPKNMENHAYREEIKNAIKGKISSSIRYSSTMNNYYSYTAIPFESKIINGVIRLSIPIDYIEKITFELIEYIIVALIISSIIALIIAFLFTNIFMKPINILTEAAEEISNGNYDKKIHINRQDQIGSLANVFNEMTVKLRINMWKLTNRKTQLEAILSNMKNGVIAVDEDYKILFYNKALCKMLMLDKNTDIVGKSIYEVIRNAFFFNVLEKSIENEDYTENEGKFNDKIIHIYANPIHIKKTKSIGILLVTEDMTEFRKLESIRKDFVSNVTHELKTPLTSIRGFIDTLKNGAIRDEKVAKKFLDIIDIESERLSTLIQDILILSEIESFQNAKNIEMNDVNIIIQEVVELLKPTTQSKNLDFIMNIQNNLPLFKCNKNRIKQLLINLIDNAYKYTEEGSVILNCYIKFDYLIFEVSDTGIGISKEDIPRLFERFYRVDKGRSRKEGGTGLGLSIVKHIVELYNGIIKVESTVSKGTTFIIKLPLKINIDY